MEIKGTFTQAQMEQLLQLAASQGVQAAAKAASYYTNYTFSTSQEA